MEKSIIKELKGCNINWADEAGNTIPRAFINFSSLKNKYEADYWVTDANGKPIVLPQKMYFKKADGVGKELALRLFGVGGRWSLKGNIFFFNYFFFKNLLKKKKTFSKKNLKGFNIVLYPFLF